MPDLLHPSDEPDADEAEEKGIDDGAFVAAGTAEDRIEADLLVRACEEAGIPATVRSPREGLMGKLSAPVDSLTILVRNTDLEKARALLSERKAELESNQGEAEKAAEAEEAETEKR